MSSHPSIAILADFPIWLLQSGTSQSPWHYSVWLMALYHAFSRQKEWNIHWITFDKNITTSVHKESGGQHFHILPRLKKTVGLLTAYKYERWAAARLLRQIQPCLVHSWGTEDCYGLCGYDFPGKKLHSVQGLLKAYIQRGGMSPFFHLQSCYEPKVLREIPHITTESPWAAERVQELAPLARPILWEYGVEPLFFSIKRQLAPTPTCLYAGTYTPIKNVDTLIHAFSQPELAHIQLLLAGIKASDVPSLPTNIIPLGGLSRDKVAQLLSETWCLVHISLADTGPTIVKEARVAGVPVILSHQCGSCQHVEQGKSGFIIDPMDINGLIRSVLYVTNSVDTSLAMGSHGWLECRQLLSDETMVSNLNRIYHQIIEDK